MTKKKCIVQLEFLPVILIALVIAVTPLASISNEAIASTNQTSSNNNTGFHSALDTYVTSEPQGYGIYEERQSNVFSPGETLLLSVEPAGMTYSPITAEGNGQLYNSKMSTDITISDNEGNILAEVPDLPVSDIISHHQNKELFLQLSLDQQSPFPPGDYVINYVVNDDISGESFEIVKEITISG